MGPTNNMTIITRRRKDAFAVIPNIVCNDERLSFEERGLLVYLLAKPDNWQVMAADIQRQGGIGRDKAYKLLNGLIAAGYVVRERVQDEATGRIAEYRYDVYDIAVQLTLPLPENTEVVAPLPDLPDTEKPLTVNTDTYKEPTVQNPPKPPEGGLMTIEELWGAWPESHRGERDTAGGAFAKLAPFEQRDATRAAPTAIKFFTASKGRFPRLSTYLRDRLFNEFLDMEVEDGYLVITPGMPEWGAWLGHMRKERGEKGVEYFVQRKRMLMHTRWPEGHRATV